MAPPKKGPWIFFKTKSTIQALVRFDASRYSVPFHYASRTLILKADHQLISIYDKEHLIADQHYVISHNILAVKGDVFARYDDQ